MKCSRCQLETPPDAEFCSECGAKLMVACAECGTPNARTYRFCKMCGQRRAHDNPGAIVTGPDIPPAIGKRVVLAPVSKKVGRGGRGDLVPFSCRALLAVA